MTFDASGKYGEINLFALFDVFAQNSCYFSKSANEPPKQHPAHSGENYFKKGELFY